MQPFVTGLATGLALIVAIGSQNAYVLRQGLRRDHVGLVVAVCLVGDVLLITLGTVGIGALVERAPVALEILRWVGVVYLLGFAVLSLRSAFTPQELTAAQGGGSVLATVVALTFLNPHVYLDTVVMLGNVINGFGDQRWLAASGAMIASAVWFCGLGFGARALSGSLGRPRTWQIIDIAVAVVMVVIAGRLALG